MFLTDIFNTYHLITLVVASLYLNFTNLLPALFSGMPLYIALEK
jgi:hypothetical protein